jgi:hypothetical protein
MRVASLMMGLNGIARDIEDHAKIHHIYTVQSKLLCRREELVRIRV